MISVASKSGNTVDKSEELVVFWWLNQVEMFKDGSSDFFVVGMFADTNIQKYQTKKDGTCSPALNLIRARVVVVFQTVFGNIAVKQNPKAGQVGGHITNTAIAPIDDAGNIALGAQNIH